MHPVEIRHQRAPVFVGSDIYRNPAFGTNHPLSIPRVATVYDLCAVLGWLDDGLFQDSPQASVEQLVTFHDESYVDALQAGSRNQRISAPHRKRYHIGTMENPIFPALFERAATSVGGSIRAAQLAAEGRITFHPSGGTHHGRPDRASGFCYFNDPVFAILTLLDRGFDRVLYVDLDAHHGDGVQDAFEDDARVLSISIHEQNRWPHTGALHDRGRGGARNLPVPAGFNDSELAFLMTEAVLPLAQEFDPEAVVVTCGADGLKDDPLSTMALSNGALWHASLQLAGLTNATVVLGGGGYNPWTVARCWTGLWGRLAGKNTPEILPGKAQAILGALACDLIDDEDVSSAWTNTLADDALSGKVRDEIRELPVLLS
ncbi:MAG: acetoin utilization protein AcuC [Methyloligellaceae bacterium]